MDNNREKKVFRSYSYKTTTRRKINMNINVDYTLYSERLFSLLHLRRLFNLE